MSDNVAELMENITLSLDLSDPDTQSFGVELGDQATTVIGVEDATDGNYPGLQSLLLFVHVRNC